jgi:transcriptional regulator with XRE-family HTH domain
MRDVHKDFGNRIRELRREQGVSQERLAELAGLDRTYVGGIERGERNPSLKNIAKIAAALRVPIKVLF